jgi:hypothetical protein
MSDTPPAAPSPGVGAPGSPGPELEDAEPLSVGRRLSRVLAVVVAVGIAGLWAYALWGPVQRTPQGRLDTATFPGVAEPICAEALAAIDALPPAYESRDAAVRADVVDDANDALAVMLDRLEAVAPPTTDDDGRMIDEWLGDWRTFLGDRERYVEALAADPAARLLVSEKDRRQVTEPIDYFATVNDMPACATPGDLA